MPEMRNSRRKFLKNASAAGMGIVGTRITGLFPGTPDNISSIRVPEINIQQINPGGNGLSLIGQYGQWAASLTEKIPSLSFRKKEWNDLKKWHMAADAKVRERLAIPVIEGTPEVVVKKQYIYDSLHVEELSWKLPYGQPADGILLKPAEAKTPLPGILAFHDHGGNKYFGTRKITRTSQDQHPLMKEHQQNYYSGLAWANEIAKRGYVVLVSDAFPFASRRVLLKDIPENLRNGLSDENPEEPKNIEAYNRWAGNHEHIMAKSLFSAGTTWPGVFLAEDRIALDILCARKDVDKEKIGCGGLSGGGMRTVFTGGLDSRIKCAVCVGFMTTWKDFVLNKSFTHTWMTYVPLLPNELDFPEILGLRVPLPTLVLNDNDDNLYTLSEMKAAETILLEIYRKAGAADKFKCSYYPGEHKFDADMQTEAFNWFDRWLK